MQISKSKRFPYFGEIISAILKYKNFPKRSLFFRLELYVIKSPLFFLYLWLHHKHVICWHLMAYFGNFTK